MNPSNSDSAHARQQSQVPVAIIGMGGCLPDAPSVDVFWDNICRNHVAIGEVPKDRWNAPLYYSADRKAVDRTYSQIGGYIREFNFDSRKFRIPPRSLACIDDLQKMALSCVAEALASAKLEIFAGDKSGRAFARERTAVIMGNSMGGEAEDLTSLRVWLVGAIDAMRQSAQAQGLKPDAVAALVADVHAKYDALLPPVTEDSMPGELSNCITGRVANAFDLWGPNFTTDAACASSIAALQMAINGLQNHEFDMAIAGGADRSMDPPTYVKFSKIGALSADGSAPFDASANGFVMGEGVGVLLLKRLDDAERDGDTIYAVVRGVGAASDGRGRGITAPNPRGQRLAIERAYAAADVSVESIGLFEAHGTSTPVGDNVELTVLTTLMREGDKGPRQIPIGSVKSMIGHLKSASGAASLIKTALALHHKVLPPSANFRTPAPQSPLGEGYLMVNTQTRPWQHTPDASGSPRRAGVSSFGFGGTNFHAVLEEYVPGAHKPLARAPKTTEGRMTTPVAAKTAAHASHANASMPASQLGPKIISLFAEATGYDVADLVPSHHLEADLGIDTVKQAEVLGLIRSQFKLPEDASFELSSMPTLQHIIDYVSGFGDTSKNTPSASNAGHDGDGSGPKGPTHAPTGAQVLVFGASNVACTVAQATSELAAASVLGGAMLTGRAEAGRAQTRLAFVADNVEQARTKVTLAGQKGARMLAAQGIFVAQGAPLADQGKVAFLFPGQGSQYLGMLKDLAQCYPIVADTFTEADRVLEPLVGHTLTPIVWAAQSDAADMLLRETQNCQPAMLTADVALLRLLMAHGVKPDMVAGHSLGEYAAAVASGVLSFADALYAVSARGREMASVKVDDVGKMAMVAADAGRVEPILAEMDGYIIAANKNCHTQTVIAGDSATVDAAITRFAKAGIEARQIAVSHAFHSSIVAPAAEPLARVLGNLDVKTPQIPLSSNVTAGYYPTGREAIVKLMADQLASPVQFIDQVERLYADGARMFVEVGPRRAITGFVRNILGQREHRALAANHPKKPGVAGFLELLASLAAEGVQIDFDGSTPTGLRADHTDANKASAKAAPSAAPITMAQPAQERVVVSGMAVAVPQARPTGAMEDDLFGPLLAGDNYIQPLVDDERQRILDKNVTRLNKRTGTFVPLQQMTEVIQLVARLGEVDLAEYGIDAALAEALDDTGRLAIATGIDALRDAGLPLMQRMRTTSTGKALHDRWALPPKLAARTGVVLASAFTGLSSIIEEVSRQAALAGRRQGAEVVQQFINTWANTLTDPSEAKRLREAFAEQIQGEIDGDVLYRFNRKWLFRALSLGHAQLAQTIFAQGPNTQINAACASGPQAMGVAEDWIRQGRCDRVVVVTADNATHPASLPWLGAAFLAAGAASVEAKLEHAAVPFGAQRNGMILGAGAAAFIVERESFVTARGMQPIAEVVHTHFGNSAFHGTRMDISYIEGFVKDAIDGACHKQQLSTEAFAKQSFFMSHETYTPARGGSAAAEVAALRHVFGKDVRQMLVANTKGRTGHPMGGSIEDAVAIKGLQRQTLPPIANFSQVDPSFEDLLFAQGGAHDRSFAVRFGAGFGSQVAVAIYRRMATHEARLQSAETYAQWLVSMGAPAQAGLEIVGRTLRVATQGGCRVEQLGIEALSVMGQAPVRGKISAQTVALVAANAPQSRPMTAAAAAPASANKPSTLIESDVLAALTARFAEATGYDAADLEPTHALEADLGIDTVKQAEIFALIRRDYGMPTDETFKLSDVQSLAALTTYVMQQAAHTGPDEAPDVDTSVAQHVGQDDVKVAAAVTAPMTTSAPTASAKAVAALPRETVLNELIKVFAEATGYDEADLDPAHALEADLGIDTVKQAEIFGMVRSTYQLATDEAFKLSEVQSLDSMADYVVSRMAEAAPVETAVVASQTPAPVRSEAQVVTTMAAPSATSSPRMQAPAVPRDAAAVLQAITQMFAEHTGYTLEDLEPEHNLEADLGIDTVKQAEIFALIRQAYGMPTDENFKLSDVQSLKAIADYVCTQGDAGPEPEPPARVPVPVVHQAPPPPAAAMPVHSQAPRPAPAQASSLQSAHSRDEVLTTLTALFAEATGYDVADFAPEHQLEADMGIDTVKQAEILAQVRTQYGIGAETQFNLSEVQTLNALTDYVMAQIASPAAADKAPAAPKAPEAAPTGAPAITQAKAVLGESVPFEARMVRLQQVTAPVASADRSGLARRRVVLAGGDPYSRKAMREALVALQADVHVLEAPSHAPGAARAQAYEARLRQMGDGLPDMLIYLAPDIQKVQWVHAPAAELFALARYWAKAAKGAPEGGLLVLGQGGGGFGFAAEQASGAAESEATYNLQGAVLAALSGAVKSLAKEWPKARCLALDVATTESWPTAVERALGAWSGWSRMPDASAELVFRDNQWWVPRRMPTAVTPSGTALGARSLVVATGGARGVTFGLLQALAARRPFQLVILGRTAGILPAQSPLYGKDDAEQKALAKAALASEHRRATPAAVRAWIGRAQARVEIHHNLEMLREAGCKVDFIACDVGDAAALGKVIETIKTERRPVDLLLHGAGIEESKFIIDKDADAFARIYNPKAEALLRLWTGLQPHRTVTMGSVSGRFGNAGQVDYAAANEMMAGLARAPQHRMLNLGWTAWGDIGMAQRGSVKQVLEAYGVALLPAALGLQMGVALIDSDIVGDVVVAGQLGAFERGEAAAENVQENTQPEGGLWPQLFDRESTLEDGAVLLERTFDPHHDVGLDHHRIDGVPVLPGVLGVEMMVQAASYVLEGPVTHLQDVQFASPAKLFRDAPLAIGVEVRVDGTSAQVALVSAFVGPRGQTMRREHFTAIASTAQAAMLLEEARADDLELARDPGLSPSDVYQRYFHGPAFQVLGQVSVLGENGGDALTQSERPAWLRRLGHDDFATMPYAREAGFQIAGLWEMVEMGRMALPSGVDVIQLSPKGQARTPHKVMARRRLSQGDVAVFDIWTLDAEGEVIDLMLGYRTVVLRELTQAERFEPFAHALWPKQPRPTSLVLPLNRVEPLLLDSASPGLEHFLAASEMTRLASFTLPKRRLEWLGARIAAKRLIRETLFGRSGATVPYNAITIERDDLGAPVVSIVGDDQPAPRISLSHSDQLAVAFLSPSPDVRCGVDCESVETRDPSFMQTYFSPREQEQAKRSEDTAYALTEMWAVKEAVLKALGLGARVDFRDVEALSGSRGWQVVLHQGAERRAHELQVGACQVEVERHLTRVIARVLLPNDGTVLPANVFTSNLEVRA